MKGLSACLLFFVPILLAAQPFLPGFNSTDTMTVSCPQDPDGQILSYQGWEAYQTLDDTWWGPRDTNICIDLAHVIGAYFIPRIAVDQIDTARPVFVRARYDDHNVLPLSTNDEYSFGFQAYGSAQFNAGPCPGGPCTGLFAGVRIPDTAGTGTDMRWYQAAYNDQAMSQYPLELCIPTEKFAQNDLREFVVSLKLINPPGGSYIEGFNNEVQDMAAWGSLVQLTSANLPNYLAGQADYYFGGWENWLVMHDNLEYPDGNHMFYLDVPPVPNTAAPTPVTVHLEPYTGFNYQPYTQLRGGLLQGSLVDRHPLTIVNNGADLCLGWEYIEVILGPDEHFVHQAGHVAFNGRNACFQFQPGSTLELAPNSRWDYGDHGRGLLLLLEGCDVRIDPGAQLVMHGRMVIKEPADATEHTDIHILLADGARLEFAPGSGIVNAWSIDGAMKLVVTLDGGTLDISGLSPADREKVVVIELPKEESTDARVMGNPVGSEIVLSVACRSASQMSIRMTDLLGRSCYQWKGMLSPGENRIIIPSVQLTAGHYLVQTKIGEREKVHRLVKE